jgi:hypothetical protein
MNNHRTFETPKGTELPILNLRGKDYLEVKYRLVWFREDHPQWSIETEFVSITDRSACARAMVKDETGRVIATSHKAETANHFPDFMEKAETGAIGRALALIGYGTQFCADELDEGDRIVDAPAQPVRGHVLQSGAGAIPEVVNASSQTGFTPGLAVSKPDLGEFQIKFGKKYMGKRLKEIPQEEIESYLKWLESNAEKKQQGLSNEVSTLKYVVNQYYHADSPDESSSEANQPAS